MSAPPPTQSGAPVPASAHPALRLALLPGELTLCRLAADAPLPAWALDALDTPAPFACVARTADELSIVCAAAPVPAAVDGVVARGWRALRVDGPLDLALVGIMARLAVPLADAGVSIFPVATHDTDYVLVRETQLDAAVAALRAAGHTTVGA
jgi:hypothetical protein